MLPYFTERFGNPSGVCKAAQDARKGVEEARRKVAQALGGVPAQTVYFTGGGTESDNLALTGFVNAMRAQAPDKPLHIVVGATEHPAVLETARYLERTGVAVSYARCDANGVITPEYLEQAMRPDTVLVSIMFANNEVGTVHAAVPVDKKKVIGTFLLFAIAFCIAFGIIGGFLMEGALL